MERHPSNDLARNSVSTQKRPPTEMVYRTILQLLGEFSLPKRKLFRINMVAQLTGPEPRVRNHCVFVCNSGVKRPPQQPYSGLYQVLRRRRNDATFLIPNDGKEATISIDRLKPSHFCNTDQHL